MPSVLFDSKADIISYGMGELQTIEMAKRLSEGYPVEALYDIRGICYAVKTSDYVPKTVVELPSYERVCESKKDYAIAARKELEEADAVRGKTLIQRHGNFILIQNPPMQPLDTKQLDYVYSLPYERWYPQCYENSAVYRVFRRYFSQLLITVVALALAISVRLRFIREER